MAELLYDPVTVAKQLVPGPEGIRLSDIELVLAAHGFDTLARTSVSMTNLMKFLRPEHIAIVHIPQFQRWKILEAHYVVVAFDHDGRLVFADPPRAPVDLSTVAKKDLLAMDGLTVLICTRQTDPKPLVRPVKSRFELTPESFPSGLFKSEIVLLNESNRPTAIVGVQVPCSCLRLDFTPTVLQPYESISYSIEIEKNKWGDVSRSISFNDAEGSVTSVEFTGSAWSKGERNSSHVPQFTLRKNISLPLNCGSAPRVVEFSQDIHPLSSERCNFTCETVVFDAVVQSVELEQTATFKVQLSDGQFESISGGVPLFFSLVVRDDGKTVLGNIECQLERTFDFVYSFERLSDLCFQVQVVVDSSSQIYSGWEVSSIGFEGVETSDVFRISEFGWTAKLTSEEMLPPIPIIGSVAFYHPEHPPVVRTLMLNSTINPQDKYGTEL